VIVIAEGVAGPGWESGWPSTENWIGHPSGTEVTTFNVAYDVLIGLNALIGTLWVVRNWRRYRAQSAMRVA
jgi:hypothetical protein